MEDPSGKFFLYGLIQPGWWFGEISVLDGHPRAQLATADGETEILVIPRSALIKELEAQPSLYNCTAFVSLWMLIAVIGTPS